MAFTADGKNPKDVYPFLDDRTAHEPFLYEILLEIEALQKTYLAGKSASLATKEALHQSRNIKMPFTPARDKNIDYILDLVSTRFTINISRIVSFDFDFDDAAKKLSTKENEEYAINMTREQLSRVIAEREQYSLEKINAIISRFRIFNLSKLIAQATFKSDLNRIVQSVLNRTIFSFKNYSINRGQIVATDEFCFHCVNYEHIKKSLDLKKIIPIVSQYADQIKLKLKNYGILSMDFSDYRDSKLDYILHILSDTLQSSVAQKDLLEVRNFQSLRECILRVDKVLDPARIYSTDIIKLVRENSVVPSHEIYSSILSVTPEVLSSWSKKDTLTKESIYKFNEPSGVEWFIEGRKFIENFSRAFFAMRSDPVAYASKPSNEREALEARLEVMYHAACAMLADKEAPFILKATPEEMEKLENMTEEYSAHVKQKILRTEVSRPSSKKKGSLVKTIINFFRGIFSVFSSSEDEDDAVTTQSSAGTKPPISKETRIICRKAQSAKDPLTALSDFIELTRENDAVVDKIINDLRLNNLKIVMPVYNARSSLYPKRSAKLLIADIEYLLIPMEAIRTPESISAYVDTLVGFKIKDDIVSSNMLILIEKYLRTIYRQKRNMMRREAAVKASAKNS